MLVVGAGPTGLLLASELVRRGVGCLLADAHDAPLGWDRATVVHPRSLQVLESLGLAERLLAQGVRVPAARIRSGGADLGLIDLTQADPRYGFDLGVSQEVTERVLTAHLEDLGGRVTRSTRVVGLRPGEDGVVAALEGAGGPREVAASWVVGCDGIRSTVRARAGIPFEGSDIAAPWAVFDAGIDGWEDAFDVTAPFLDVPPVILTPLPGRRWRVYLRPTTDDGDLVAEAEAVVRRYAPGARFTGVEHPTRFRCHSRVAAGFRSGRMLLAGDAAHACSPAEGHGMNTGLQDAFNLGWKLALVCRGAAGPGLLDTYEAERRPVALRVVASGDDVEVGHALTTAKERAVRDAAILAAFADPAYAHHEAVAQAETDRCYAGCGLALGDPSDALGPGDLLPTTGPVHPAGAAPCALHELTHHPGHTLLVLGGPEADGAEVAALAQGLGSAHAGSALVDAVAGLAVRDGGMDAGTARQLGVSGTTILAVRPDRYVGLRHDGPDAAAAVAGYLTLLAR